MKNFRAGLPTCVRALPIVTSFHPEWSATGFGRAIAAICKWAAARQASKRIWVWFKSLNPEQSFVSGDAWVTVKLIGIF
jgi:hypothetical protein